MATSIVISSYRLAKGIKVQGTSRQFYVIVSHKNEKVENFGQHIIKKYGIKAPFQLNMDNAILLPCLSVNVLGASESPLIVVPCEEGDEFAIIESKNKTSSSITTTTDIVDVEMTHKVHVETEENNVENSKDTSSSLSSEVHGEQNGEQEASGSNSLNLFSSSENYFPSSSSLSSSSSTAKDVKRMEIDNENCPVPKKKPKMSVVILDGPKTPKNSESSRTSSKLRPDTPALPKVLLDFIPFKNSLEMHTENSDS